MKTILIIKIFTTTFLWAIPLLFGTPELFGYLGIPFPEPVIFMRLLGMAYFTLVFLYYHGYKLIKLRKNILVAEVIVSTGIVSNGLAFIVLFIAGTSGEWNDWTTLGKIYMWSSTVLTFLFAAGLQISFKKNII